MLVTGCVDAEASSRRLRQLPIFVLAGLTISLLVWFTYAPGLTLGFTGWDTIFLIHSAHSHLTNSFATFFVEPLLPGFPFYRPLSLLSYGLEYYAWGLDARGYHLTNLFIHWGVCLGLVILGYQAAQRVVVGLVAGTLMALQPLFGTMIPNLAQRQDSLMTLGIIWTLIFTFASLRTAGLPDARRRSVLLQCLSWCAFILALGAKETGLVALPLVLLVIATRAEPTQSWKRRLARMLPFVLFTLGYLYLRSVSVGRPVPLSAGTGMDGIALALMYLQPLVSPGLSQPLAVQAGGVLFLASIAILFYLNRNSRARLWWWFLCIAWFSFTILFYWMSDIREFIARYGYILAAPLVLVLALAFFTEFLEQPRALILAGYAGKLILAGMVLLWLPSAPLFGLEKAWVGGEKTANAQLAELDRVVRDIPPATGLELENVPPRWLWLDNAQSWLDLKWAGKKFRILKQTAAVKTRRNMQLSVEPQTPREWRLSAIYLSRED